MPGFRAPRGTRDLLPADRPAWERIIALANDLARRYGYASMETPLFEQTGVFERSIGEATDVVEKELFRIAPRGEEAESWSLRPEATAGIIRAYVQHGMRMLPQPVRVHLLGPMFRYDRPQAGRYRQFWQWDVEAVGDAGPGIDAEIVELGYRFYTEAGVSRVNVLLNSIGDPACRPAYVKELVEYFAAHHASLPDLEQARLEANPLRLLDSKDPDMVALIAGAPQMADRLCSACADHFAAVQEYLAVLGVPVRLQPSLVRGLDYYTRTAFEYYREGAEGQQQALGGGGRYDGLVEIMGGRPTPGIGFALGLDRTVLALAEDGTSAAVAAGPRLAAYVTSADPGATATRLEIVTRLRSAGLASRADLGTRRLGRQLEQAARENAHFAVIVGDELAQGQVQLRDLEAGTQREVPLADLVKEIARAEAAHRHG
jgi:histidyl-tRNA synthetase